MKVFLAAVLLITGYFSFGQSNIDVLHYQFGIGLSDQSDTIHGRTFVTIKFNQPVKKFWLRLTSIKDKGKGMICNRVLEMGKPVNLIHSNDTLMIIPDSIIAKDQVRTFEILYTGIPSDGLIISENKYGDRSFCADNWPDRAHHWLPCKDEPGDKASFEFIVTAPSQYRVISNGMIVEEKVLPGEKKLTHWKEEIPLSTKVMVIGVSKFAVKIYNDSPPNIPVSAWVYPQDSVKAFANYSPAPAIVKFFSEYIGPYPYKKLANVQSKTMFGGMENASAIFYYEESGSTDRSVEDLLAHEIAHQWFGDMASEKSFTHVWLSEGFATYLTDIYIQSKYGNDSMNNRLKKERNTVVNFAKRVDKPVVDSVSSFMDLLNANSYQKGAWILHMLRKQIGDELFHRFIRTYYERYKGKNADSQDLIAVAEEVSKKELRSFFRQWLYTPGIPQLNIKWNYNEKEKKAYITVTQLQKKNIFRFPLEIALQSGDNKKARLETLHVTKASETFVSGIKETVQNLIADPNTSLLFDGKVERIKQ